MKKIVIIFLLSTYVCATTELGQFLKLPILVVHFFDHSVEEKDMTFWDYLVHHYGGHERDADWEIDMKLPFMQCVETLNIPIVSPDAPIQLSTRIDDSAYLKLFSFYNDVYLPNSHQNKIWQPPRFC